MHMMVCSEWAGATLPSRVAPQKFCIIMLLSQHVLGPGKPDHVHLLTNRRLEKRRKKWKTTASI